MEAAVGLSPTFKTLVLRSANNTNADRCRDRCAAELSLARKNNNSRTWCARVSTLSSSIGITSSDNGDEQVNILRSVGLTKKTGRRSKDDLPPISIDKLDEWMRESVVEIARNTKEGPFLVHVFPNRAEDANSIRSSPTSIRFEMEPVLSQSWESIKERWNRDGCFTPDGIILVEELHTEKDRDRHKDEEQGEHDNFNKSSTRTWGLLVQGRGLDYCACYILNTSRVLSSVGASTHFCLVKARCFSDSVDVQLMKAWLQQQDHW